MSDTVPYRPRAGEIPTAPGVYRFRDENRRVLYVGKAKNLRARLSNYFAPLKNLHERTRRMVTTAASVEWTVVANEFEALQLEFTWIKEFNPPFNVQFRDDKTYPYLAVTLGDDVPRVLVTRNRSLKGAKYFGPYTKVWAIRESLDLMLKAFPMRSCSQGVYRRAELTGRPCLLGDIGKCAAPCVGRVSKEEHREIAKNLVAFMGGADRRQIAELRNKMQQAALAQNYEGAARYRDAMQALETVMEKTAVVLSESVDADVFGVAHDELAAAVQQFIVRGGRIRGVRSWIVDKELDLDLAELVDTVLQNAYSSDDFAPPREVFVPELPEDSTELELWLTERRRAIEPATRATPTGKVALRVAQRGEKAKLAATAALNAGNALVLYKTRRSSDFVARSQALTDIQEALGMAEAPLRIECFDVSHLSGTNIVASMVVFEDGLPRKDQYRRFNVASSTDDTDSIRQVIARRAAYLADGAQHGDEGPLAPAAAPDGSTNIADLADTADLASGLVPGSAAEPAVATTTRFAYRPQLLVVDGGEPQVQAAAEALAAAGVTDIALCGIAKRLEEIWLPHNPYPVILPRNSDALFLMQRVRDEAHRFAISHQRKRRSKSISTVLADIPGLGPARSKALLQHFGSVTRLRAATLDELAEVPGVGPALAAIIRDRLSPAPAGENAAVADG